MSEDFIIRAPIKVKPELPKGRFHKLCITPDSFEISSWENLYGNKKSEKLFSVTHRDIIEIEFKMPLVQANEGYCKIIFEDELGKQSSKRFCILGPNGYHQNEITEEVADLLGMLGDSRFAYHSHSSQTDIPLEPPKSIRKILYGLLLFSGMFLSVGLAGGISGLLFAGLFLLIPSLIATGIDYVRLVIGWSTWLKLVAYLLIFVLGFILMVTTFFFIDYYGLLY